MPKSQHPPLQQSITFLNTSSSIIDPSTLSRYPASQESTTFTVMANNVSIHASCPRSHATQRLGSYMGRLMPSRLVLLSRANSRARLPPTPTTLISGSHPPLKSTITRRLDISHKIEVRTHCPAEPRRGAPLAHPPCSAYLIHFAPLSSICTLSKTIRIHANVRLPSRRMSLCGVLDSADTCAFGECVMAEERTTHIVGCGAASIQPPSARAGLVSDGCTGA